MKQRKKNTGGHTQPQAATATEREKNCALCHIKTKPDLDIQGNKRMLARLADWIWQGVTYLGDEIAEDAKLGDESRINYLLGEIQAAAKLHYQLIGMSGETAENEAQRYVNLIKQIAYGK